MSSFNQSKVPLVAECLFRRIEDRIRKGKTKQISDEDLLSLHSVFGAVLQRALDILEKQNTFVAYTTASKSKVLIEVKGENDRCYRVFPKINFCPCLAFKHQVLERKSQLYCKHALVARIAQILDKVVENKVTQEQYLMLVLSMFNLEEKDG